MRFAYSRRNLWLEQQQSIHTNTIKLFCISILIPTKKGHKLTSRHIASSKILYLEDPPWGLALIYQGLVLPLYSILKDARDKLTIFKMIYRKRWQKKVNPAPCKIRLWDSKAFSLVHGFALPIKDSLSRLLLWTLKSRHKNWKNALEEES